jgi:hypothetical protein
MPPGSSRSSDGAHVFRGIEGAPVFPEPIPLAVNRPYLVSIIDVPTGAVLFLGHIADPTQTGSP